MITAPLLKALAIFFGCIGIMLLVALAFVRQAAKRIAEAEAAKLARSFEAEAIAEAERKKQRIAEQLAQAKADAQTMSNQDLERKVNE